MSGWPQSTVIALELGLIAYALFISVTIVIERRRPTATMAWILLLVLLPPVGMVTYWVLGRRRARKVRKGRRGQLAPTEATAHMACLCELPPHLPAPVVGLVKLGMRTSAAPVRHAREVEILPEAAEAFLAMERAITQAQHRIHAQFYIWRDDETGARMIELLSERARAGVKVRLLTDDLGSLATPAAHFAPLIEAGGQVARFGPLRLRLRRPSSRIDFRNHRKMLCIDGEVAFTGGLNVANEYRGRTTSGTVWNDLLVRLSGDVVLGLEAVFSEDWLRTTGELVELDADLGTSGPGLSMTQQPRTPPVSTGPIVQIISSGPDHIPGRSDNNPSVIAASFVAAIGLAQRRVSVVTPYFIPDEPLKRILETAAMRGVEVKILVPNAKHNDSRFVALAARSYYDSLLEAGCQIFEYAPGMLHAKYMVIDDVLAVIGSANMDVRSLYLDYEITAMFYDHDVTEALAAVFRGDLAEGVEVQRAQRAQLSLSSRFAEGVARMLSPLL